MKPARGQLSAATFEKSSPLLLIDSRFSISADSNSMSVHRPSGDNFRWRGRTQSSFIRMAVASQIKVGGALPAECDLPRIPGTRNFSFFWWYWNQYQKNWYRKKFCEQVSEKFDTGKKYWSRHWKNLAPEKGSEPVSEKFGTGADFCCKNIGILKIYNGYQKYLVAEKSLGTSNDQI